MSNESKVAKIPVIRDADYFAKAVKIGDIYHVPGYIHRVTGKNYRQLADHSVVVTIEHKYQSMVNDDDEQVFEEELFNISEADVYFTMTAGDRLYMLADGGFSWRFTHSEFKKLSDGSYELTHWGVRGG
ncbi:hypothetical protein PMI35_04446 [Pseudomonas sp. GM78]|uniref:hypothetical protein n=1 Tax=Pseudomonas sp. GM78 TaxID=1144337 RepID=UPI000270D0D1|nr:hypothetical protein [Pseudomonas sp. GM78]EJN23900.1 hypothetical protein PMI35_04446 [Pseudomonas sp. GM78]